MKRKKLVLSFLILLMSGSMLVSKRTEAAYEDGLSSPYSTVYDDQTGIITKDGNPIKATDSVVRLAYQGNDIIGDGTVTSTRGTVSRLYVDTEIRKNEVVRIKNVGTLAGKKLVFAISPISHTFGIQKVDGGIRPYSFSQNGVPADTWNTIDMWLEDENQNKIKDPSAIFLMSSANRHRATNMIIDFYFINQSSDQYYIIPSTNVGMKIDKATVTQGSQFLIKSDANDLYPESRPYGFGFKQTNGEITHFGRKSNSRAILNQDVFLNFENKIGIKLPYQAPAVLETKNDKTSSSKWNVADLEVVQQLLTQSFDAQYPDPLEITVNTGSFVRDTDIDASAIKVVTSKTGQEIQEATVSVSETGEVNGTLKVSIPREKLKELGDDTVTVKADLPLNVTNKSLYSNIVDGYVTIPNITAKNNEHPNQSSANLSVKLPGPTGDAVQGIAVKQGTASSTLVPKELVTNLKSTILDDSVEVVGFKAAKTFSTVKEDDIVVVVKSTHSGLTTDITVPITVYPRDLAILDPLAIVPESNKVATTKSELTYNPIFRQVVKTSTNNTTQVDNVKLIASYSDFLQVENSDFTVYSNNVVVDSSKYNLSLDTTKKEVVVSIGNTVMKELLGKTVEIRQKSKLDTSDVGIVDFYDKNSKQFTFPIVAYNTFGQVNSQLLVTQTPKSENAQVISYQPKITADAVSNEKVYIGDAVKDAKDYLTNVSQPDFDFDSYEISFEDGEPNFDKAGELTFNVLVQSKSFGNSISVPVKIDVLSREVNANVSLIENNSKKPILSDIKNGTPLGTIELKKLEVGKNLADVMKDIMSDSTKLKLDNYIGYTRDTLAGYKIFIDGEDVTDTQTIVPDKNFEVRFYYNGEKAITKVPDVNFGKINISNQSAEKYALKDSENTTVEMHDTRNTENTKLTVSLEGDITAGKDNIYGGQLYYTKGSDADIAMTSNTPILVLENKKDSVFNSVALNGSDNTKSGMYLVQTPGNYDGDYEGTLLWKISSSTSTDAAK